MHAGALRRPGGACCGGRGAAGRRRRAGPHRARHLGGRLPGPGLGCRTGGSGDGSVVVCGPSVDRPGRGPGDRLESRLRSGRGRHREWCPGRGRCRCRVAGGDLDLVGRWAHRRPSQAPGRGAGLGPVELRAVDHGASRQHPGRAGPVTAAGLSGG